MASRKSTAARTPFSNRSLRTRSASSSWLVSVGMKAGVSSRLESGMGAEGVAIGELTPAA